MRFSIIISVAAWFLTVMSADAMEPKNAPKGSNNKAPLSNSKVALCDPGTAVAQLDFNNARVRIENGGNMWQNRSNGTASYEIPKGSGKRSLFAGALWMGGVNANDQLKLAAVTFRARGNDYFPGPLTQGLAEITSQECIKYDRFFRASKADVIKHISYTDAVNNGTLEDFGTYKVPNYFYEWPAKGGPGQSDKLAPWKDVDGDGDYDPDKGDYPFYDLFKEIECRSNALEVPLFGDTTIYWIFNDKGNIHTETGSEPIGMEIRAQAFAFASQTAINNMTFYNYVLINQGSEALTNTYFGQWADADLGNPADDYVGCDVSRGLGFAYNGDADDEINGGQAPGYGTTPPAVGIDFFEGPFQDKDGLDNYGPYNEKRAPFGTKEPRSDSAILLKGIPYLGLGIGYGDGKVDNERFGMRKFVYYNIGNTDNGDPTTGINYYNYLTGTWKNNAKFVFGGDAFQTNITSIECDFMFPGDTDPLDFGTRGVAQPYSWTESNNGGAAPNPPGDRRFMQSAGPFNLNPGAVNNITVGVVWARAESGDNLSSIQALKSADDLAQALFDNCFQVFEGPDAPDLTASELDKKVILFIDNNNPRSNNFGESYSADRTEQEGDNGGQPVTYKFEGYIIYQVKDATVSVAQLSDPNQARLAFQCDIKNFNNVIINNRPVNEPISKLLNYEVDEASRLPFPIVKVTGANKGISKSFVATNDLFATGADVSLVNNKPYYYIAIAYGYNNYRAYNPDPKILNGQFEQFVPSRKNGDGGSIKSITVIPRKTESLFNGTILHSEYGITLPVTRLEGSGNGGFFTDIDETTEAEIMSGSPWQAKEIKYKVNASPVSVKVIDPLRVIDASYELRLIPGNNNNVDSARWILKNLNNDENITSKSVILTGSEELILKYGISITMPQSVYKNASGFVNRVDALTDVVGGEMVADDTTKAWLTGVVDRTTTTPLNWIRSGNNSSASPGTYNDNQTHKDPNATFARILGGTWSPYVYSSYNSISIGGGVMPSNSAARYALADNSNRNLVRPALLKNVDVVFTADKSKWTRVPVLESNDVASKALPKSLPSVDKNGKPWNAPGANVEEGRLISENGMGWFPGYAINVETGERLNMAFGEDSQYPEHNGNDMIWNPTSTETVPGIDTVNYVFGGRHYIWVFKNTQHVEQWLIDGVSFNNSFDATQIGNYDQGQKLMDLFNVGNNASLKTVWSSATWVTIPLLRPGTSLKSVEEGLIPTTTRVKLRVAKRYEAYPNTANGTLEDMSTALNNWYPLYRFKSEGYAVEKNAFVTNNVLVNKVLDNIRAVPNPYYAISNYESTNLDNRIKFTNLPDVCTVSIYTIDGTLIRRFSKDQANTIIEWDMKNFANIPISSGSYLFHINAPGAGEKVIKWFGVMRRVDLQNK